MCCGAIVIEQRGFAAYSSDTNFERTSRVAVLGNSFVSSSHASGLRYVIVTGELLAARVVGLPLLPDALRFI